MTTTLGSDRIESVSRDGQYQLVGSIWRARQARASVVLVHGLSDHGSRYRDLAEWLALRHYSVLALDLRGHGKSSGQRGHADRWSDLQDDCWTAIMLAQGELPELPLFLLGHSMGGTLVLTLVRDRALQFSLLPLRGLVSLSPLVLAARQPPLWLRCVAHTLSVVYPRFSVASRIDVADLSHDISRVEAFRNDPLRPSRTSVRLATELFRAGRRLLDSPWSLPCDALVMHGSDDRLTDPAATSRMLQRLDAERYEWQLWPGQFHELCQELVREEVYRRITDWLDRHLADSQTLRA